MFRRLFWRNLLLAIPVLVFSDQIQDWFGYEWSFPGSQWIAPVLGALSDRIGRRKPIYVISASVCLAGWCALVGFPRMPVPVIVALLVAACSADDASSSSPT